MKFRTIIKYAALAAISFGISEHAHALGSATCSASLGQKIKHDDLPNLEKIGKCLMERGMSDPNFSKAVFDKCTLQNAYKPTDQGGAGMVGPVMLEEQALALNTSPVVGSSGLAEGANRATILYHYSCLRARQVAAAVHLKEFFQMDTKDYSAILKQKQDDKKTPRVDRACKGNVPTQVLADMTQRIVGDRTVLDKLKKDTMPLDCGDSAIIGGAAPAPAAE